MLSTILVMGLLKHIILKQSDFKHQLRGCLQFCAIEFNCFTTSFGNKYTRTTNQEFQIYVNNSDFFEHLKKKINYCVLK